MDDLSMFHTDIFRDELLHCDELKNLQMLISRLPSETIAWKEKINQMMADSGHTKAEFAKLCEVSRTAATKWCNGSMPSGRDDFIKIGFAANYSLGEMNHFLQRYGKCPELYAKSLEDSVYIFVLNSKSLPHTYAFCQEVIAKIKDAMHELKADSQSYYDTVYLHEKLLHLESVDMLTEFIKESAVSYQSAYEKLYAYINAFIEMNNRDFVTGEVYSIDFLAKSQNWSSSFYKCVSAIRQKKWFPIRRKVIALGLHLNMVVDQINEMLRLARMETLCAKNLTESAIIYAVEDADVSGLICCDGGTELCEHVREILESLHISDAEKLLGDI